MGLVQDRTLLMKSYALVCVGKEVIDFFVNCNQCASRAEVGFIPLLLM